MRAKRNPFFWRRTTNASATRFTADRNGSRNPDTSWCWLAPIARKSSTSPPFRSATFAISHMATTSMSGSADKSHSISGRANSTATMAADRVMASRSSCAFDRHSIRTTSLQNDTRSATELGNDAVKNSTQRNEGDRAEDSFGQNVPGYRLILEFPFEQLVPEKEGINANDKNNQGSGNSD